MKKQLLSVLLFCLLLTGVAFAEPFSIRVNGKTDYPANPTGEPDMQGRTQYLASCVKLAAGDVVTCYDESSKAEWTIGVIDPYGAYANFTVGTKVTCNVAGVYDFYIKLKFEDDMLYIGENNTCTPVDPDPNPDPDPDPDPDPENPGEYMPKDYTTSVPAQCPDVMLQGFYWDSNTNQGHGDTKWKTLLAQASEIGAYFDMVWLPPSAKSSGGVGYLPSQYSNQTSAWGTRAELEALIAALHATDTKVIADIVINHANNKSTWCDFYDLDFGKYGKFSPTAAWICKTDEVNTKGPAGCKGKATGAADDGYGSEANYPDARDWDHCNATVRSMFRAYLQWMKYDMKYDGWRYDYCKGFHGSHVNEYNSAAKNYFSVTEYWDGDPNVLAKYINDVGKNTLTFDFATKYTALNRGIAQGNYAGCKGAGLLGRGMGKYAVTFVDSHDTYQRDGNEFGGAGQSMKMKDKLLQANAYILSMPGVPCVFYPHWVTFKNEISKMIIARHATGVHSESAVSDEAGNGFYRATITGKNGSIKLFLGPNSGYATAPAGYTLAVKGNGYGVYYQTTTPVAPTLIVSPGNTTFKDNTKGVTITMQAVGAGNATIYYTLDGSNPKTSPAKQTYSAPVTVKQTTTLKAYAVSGTQETAVQTYTYTYKEPQTTPITVRFYKPASWSKVYLYAWSATDETTYLGKWPGTELTASADGWYSYQFDAALKEVNFIFNAGSGKDQTADLYTDEDVCYAWENGAEKLVADCQMTAVENIQAATRITVYPNPVHNLLMVQTESELATISVYSLTGQCQKAESCQPVNNVYSMDIAGLQAGMYLLRLRTKAGECTTQLFIKQ